MDFLKPEVTDSFVYKLSQQLKQFNFGEKSDGMPALVALSGGPDSTALLVALWVILQTGKQVTTPAGLSALHINYGLRGAESEGDEEFCVQLCRDMGVPLHIVKSTGLSTSEEALRNFRYGQLLEAAQRDNTPCVLTAHTADDQIETILFRLFRGSSPTGLTGMEVSRPLSADVRLLRPMLALRRREVLEFLGRIELTARHDSSNNLTDYSRNYIRHKVIPYIEAGFIEFGPRLLQLREIIAAEEVYWSQVVAATTEAVQSHSENNWSLTELETVDAALKRRLVATAFRERGIEPSFERVEIVRRICEEKCGAVSLNDEWDVKAERGLLRWIVKHSNAAQVVADESQEVKVPGRTIALALGHAVIVREFDETATGWTFPAETAAEVIVDLRPVCGRLVLRRRRQGDVIRPFGMNQLVKLKKYLHTHKREWTDDFASTIVLADDEEVLWVPGVGLSNKLKVNGNPTHQLEILQLSADDIALA